MKIRTLLGVMAAIWSASIPLARAVSPTPGEMAEARRWAAAKLEGVQEAKGPEVGAPLSAEPPFSFTLAGKRSADFLKSWRMERTSKKLDDGRTARTTTYSDPATGLEGRCEAVEYADFPVVEWTVRFRNAGTANTPIIERIEALDARWQRGNDGEFVLHCLKGDDCTLEGYRPFDVTLAPNAVQKFAAARGRPTSESFPYYNLQMPGGGAIVTVGWPGQWASSFTRDAAKGLQITAGQELTHLYLKPGEEIRTPLVALLFWKGSDPVRAQNIWRRWMLKYSLPGATGRAMPPILVMGTSGYYPGLKSSAANEIKDAGAFVKGGAKLDYWWIDAGWYPCDADWGQTGTWQPDPVRYPKGIKEVSDYLHSQGMKLIVWFEPERVAAGTWLTDKHPEWILGGKNGGLLNLGNPEAWKWLVNHFDSLITQQGIDFYRQDYNIDPLNHWRGNDPADRQGITENLHVQGYLAYWDELRRRHPEMPIDSCASGGRRNDLETLRRSVPLLRTDFCRGNPIVGQCMTYGLASWIPYYGAGVDAFPPAEADYKVRSDWCPSSMINPPKDKLDNETVDWKQYLRIQAEFRKAAPYLLGDFYPLTPYSQAETDWMAWQFGRPDLGEGMVQAFRRGKCASEGAKFRLKGLVPDAIYTLTNLDVAGTTETTGRALLEDGLTVTIKNQPGAAVIIYKKKP